MSVDLEDITALVGRNDAGKSSIMDALDIFLNDKTPDGDDASKHGDPKDLAIVCEFEGLPTSLVLDSAASTTLENEHLLNERGNLEIEKIYSGNLANPKLVSVSAKALHPTAKSVDDLLQLKNKALKDRAKALGVDLTDVDQKVNPALRQAIRLHVADLDVVSTIVPLNEENGRDIWKSLSNYLPIFQLFKSDRQSTDQDPEAQDPLKMAVREAIKQKQAELDKLVAFVEAEVRSIADATLAKLKEMDPTLASELKPEFAKPRWESLFKTSIVGDQGIPVNKRGSGVKRLILLNFFRAKAEMQAQERADSLVIYGIEEPETSQHPRNQRLLLRAFEDLSSESQVVITTHTPMLARALPDRCLRYIGIDDEAPRTITVGGRETNELFARSLGVLPDNSVKLFIGVEGPNDIAFLMGMSRVLRGGGVDVLDLEQLELEGELIFFPLGGSTLALWTSRLAHLGRPEFHLYDRDAEPPELPRYHAQIEEINARDSCVARATNKRESESYLHGDAIRAAYRANGLDIELPEVFADFDDVPEITARTVYEAAYGPGAWAGLDLSIREKKASKVKKVLNRQAVGHMTFPQLQAVDPAGEVISWFEDMRALQEAG